MTISDVQKEDSSSPDGPADATSTAAELVSDKQRAARGAAIPARRVDYRLRGLDFDASAFRPDSAPPPVIYKEHPSRVYRRRRLVIQWLLVLTVLASTVVILRAIVVQPYTVRSTAMVPNIQPGTNVLVLRPSLLTGPIKLGEVIFFHQPNRPHCSDVTSNSRDMVKRVIGLPGQRIHSEGQRIYIDGQPLEEPGWYNVPFGEVGSARIPLTTVPPDSYFVMGDNRTDPCDSRSFGAIPGSSIVGTVVASTWRGGHPFAHFV